MRPVAITIEGLRSFRSPVTIDFADRELVAIIGDTGAGKSSILEAMTWALYGNATWTQHAGVLMGDGCPQMRARLLFEADGNRWQVTRAVKRRQDGTPGAANAELVCLDGDRPAADNVRNVNDAVRRLLGLDWNAFIRTVVLPQGKFARLLTEGDVERSRILSQIWRTDELVDARQQADDALRELASHLDYLRGLRKAYPEDVGAALEEASARAQDTEVAVTAVDSAVREVQRRMRAALDARRVASAIAAAAAAVEEALSGDEAQEAKDLAQRATNLARELADLDAHIVETERHLLTLDDAESDGGPDREATARAVTVLDGIAASIDDLATTMVRVDDLTVDANKARDDVDALAQQVGDTLERVQQAEEQETHWRRLDAAAAAAHGLGHGDDCPVCSRALPDGWAAPDAAGLADATTALRDARDAERRARDAHSAKVAEANALATQAEQARGDLARRLARVADAVADLPDAFRPGLPMPFTIDRLGPEDLTDTLVRDARAAAHERREGFEARDARLNEAREGLHRLREKAAGLRDQQHTTVTEPATRLRARLVRVGERLERLSAAGVDLPAQAPSVGESPQELVADADAVVTAARTGMTAAATGADAAERTAVTEEQALSALLATHDATSPEALSDRQVALRAEAKQARDRAEELGRLVPVVAALDDHLGAGEAVTGGLTDLKTLLQDGRFIRWLTLRRSRALLGVASTLLDEITGGRYAFADITDEHDEWRIFDTATGYARSPRTLSGGESFVASLALALGMVEMVARSGGRLDALFLDEGFGALDPDNLDAAIDALESSATRGRMVAVITHVQAVAERLTDVLAVHRGPTGSDARWLTSSQRDGVAISDAAAAAGVVGDLVRSDSAIRPGSRLDSKTRPKGR